MKGTVSKIAGKWFLSITVEVNKPVTKNKKAIGIDLGLKTQIVCSNNNQYNYPEIKKWYEKVKKEQRKLSKKQIGSNNFNKQKFKLQKAWYYLDCKKTDWIEKTTTEIAKNYEVVALENLNIKGMMKNRKLSGKFQQVSLYRIIERLKTKANQVIHVDRFFPSSKMCSKCGNIKSNLKLSDRVYKCQCGLNIDRDLNASINIVRQAMSESTFVDKYNYTIDIADTILYNSNC